ncbi:MAG: NAD(P)/FAD-dependent oxidoreductase [Bdellovibrionales bacterium]|nr:NAD(P)/FAD-dependent oxidoreductase [Bdellovibrionales bacterium]
MSESKKWDVVIVGSGISSLTAAIVLLEKGKSVLLLEKYRKPGGYLHCFNRYTCRFDTGAHYVGSMSKGQPFHTLLTYLGVLKNGPEEFFVRLDDNGFDVLKFPGAEIEVKNGIRETIQSFSKSYPAEEKAISQFFLLSQEVARSFPTFEFNPDYDSAFVNKYMALTLKEVVENLTSNPGLQIALYAYCSLHGVAPADVSFGFHSLLIMSLLESAWGFRTGGDTLTKKFIERIQELGGEIRLGAGVKGLRIEDKFVKAVKLENDEEILCENVISGVHPKQTFRWVGDENLKPAFKQRLQNTRESMGIFGIYAVSEIEPKMSRTKNYYVFDNLDPSKISDSLNGLGKPWAAYISRTERIDEKRKYHPLTIHVPCSYRDFAKWLDKPVMKRGDDYENAKREFAEQSFEFIGKYFPDAISNITKYDTSTPLSNIHYNGSEEGSSYGIYHDIGHTGVRALGPRTPVRNLFITGQSTLFPGLYPSAISGVRCAGNLIGIKPIIADLKTIQLQGRKEFSSSEAEPRI